VIGIGLAIQFLEETLGAPEGDARSRSLNDLKQILNGGGSVEDLVTWVTLWYS